MRAVLGVLILCLWLSELNAKKRSIRGKDETKILMYGDIMMTPQQLFSHNLPDNVRSKLFMKDNGHARWPKNTVPYEISDKYNEKDRKIIQDALKDMQQKTCFKFPEKTDGDKDYVFIEPLEDCHSDLGHQGGKQIISLAIDGCVFPNTVQHEMMHAIGFDHEHQRPDRDTYIEVLTDNIPEKDRKNFVKYKPGLYDLREFKYDIKSIMHYHGYAFGKPTDEKTYTKQLEAGEIPPLTMKTMVLKRTQTPVGLNSKMSENDIRKINSMGSCPNSKPVNPKSQGKPTGAKKKATCKDLNYPGRPSDCPKTKYLCNNPIYYPLMTQQCPLTCNRC